MSAFAAVRAALEAGADPVDLALDARRRAAEVEGVFTALCPPEVIAARAAAASAQARAGKPTPLLGLTFSVKDNIHVAGMATTLNCPGFAIHPDESAQVVLKLEAAGAVLIGKNTMDQFATGLNGTRSPEPLCRNAIDPAYIPGGSSSGSAVAVARDIVSFALGSDTGGSGRVPAACNGIVGLKPTIGLVSGRGTVYNSRFLDCVPVFTRRCADANEILRIIAGYDSRDPCSRRDADDITLAPAAPSSRRIAVPRAGQMNFFGDDAAQAAFAANIASLRALGFETAEIDFAPFEEAGRLVFLSAMVAERLVDYGDFVATHRDAIHPVVLAAIEPGEAYSARDAFAAVYRMQALQRVAQDVLSPFAALAVPTVPTVFTIADMLAEPVARNAIMGTYTYFVNPLDLCALSVPGAALPNGLVSGLCLVGLAGRDGEIAGLAEMFEGAA